MRYFFFTYYTESDSQYANGNMWFENDIFPSNKEIIDRVRLKNLSKNIIVIVTGWHEFASKEDYDNFCGEEE